MRKIGSQVKLRINITNLHFTSSSFSFSLREKERHFISLLNICSSNSAFVFQSATACKPSSTLNHGQTE
jgi:hypothetical protein